MKLFETKENYFMFKIISIHLINISRIRRCHSVVDILVKGKKSLLIKIFMQLSVSLLQFNLSKLLFSLHYYMLKPTLKSIKTKTLPYRLLGQSNRKGIFI